MPALLVALAGLLVGELLRRRLVTGGYHPRRRPRRAARALGPVVPVLVAASWWLVAARVAEPAGWVAVPHTSCLSSSAWAAPGSTWTSTASPTAAAPRWRARRGPAGGRHGGDRTLDSGRRRRGGVAAYLAFFLPRHLPAWGGPAYGDVRLAAVLSAALGWLSPWLALLGGGGRLRRQQCRRHRAAPRPAGRPAYRGGLPGRGWSPGRSSRSGSTGRASRIHLLSRSRPGRGGVGGSGHAAMVDGRESHGPALVAVVEGIPAGVAA